MGFGSRKFLFRITQLTAASGSLFCKAPAHGAFCLEFSMSLLERIPTLSDDEVVNLLANAQRLAEQGDDKQKAAAMELLPALQDEADSRKNERLERAKAKRAATRKATQARVAA
jgi:hypothetical protein